MSPELKRASSKRTSWKIIPYSYSSNRVVLLPTSSPTNSHQSLIPSTKKRPTLILTTLLRSLLSIISIRPATIPSCGWLTVPSFTPSASRQVVGTLFGHRNGHVSLAMQLDSRSEPLLLLELAVSTSSLVREMAAGMARIALECERGQSRVQLIEEPVWTMYCNGRRCGYAVSRMCEESDWYVLRAVQTVSVGAGVLPAEKGKGQVMYMRARFERVMGSKDSEALYMLNLEGNGGPELTIFLVRI